MSLDIKLEGLWPHQVETYNTVVQKQQTFCTSSPGVGKSLPHAKLVEYAIKNEGCTFALIVCPKTLMHTTWKHEFETFIPDLEIGIAEAPESNRKKVFESGTKIVILNIDGVSWLNKQPVKWLKKTLGTNALLIIDESDAYKNPSAMRTKAMLKLAPLFVRKHLLAGTPAPNTITELWPQAFILDGGKRLGSRYSAFRNLMQAPVSKGPFVQWVDKPQSAEITYGLLSDLIIHHEFDDVMTQVPQIQHQVMHYELSKKHREYYISMEKKEYIEHKNKIISAINAGDLANKLLQIASGAVYNPDRSWSLLDKGRYELITELVDSIPFSVVFFQWTHQRLALEAEFKAKGITYDVIDGSVKDSKKRSEIIERFQNGELRTLLLQPLSAGHGVTLTQADTVIFASPVYQGNLFKQCIARIRRGVQRKNTRSITILAKETRDLHAYEVFTGKLERIEALNNLFWKGYGPENEA